jgi:hypothetical protein
VGNGFLSGGSGWLANPIGWPSVSLFFLIDETTGPKAFSREIGKVKPDGTATVLAGVPGPSGSPAQFFQ